MKESTRFSAIILGSLFAVAILTGPALATEEDPAETPPAPEVTTDVLPAVEVTSPPNVEATPDWTYRYMVPTGLLLAVVIIVITSIQYFTRVVRRRYRIVEE